MTALQFKNWRLSKNLSQSKLAKFWGISIRNIHKWERGAAKVPPLAIALINEIEDK